MVSRVIQPFHTATDGDVLWALTTGKAERPADAEWLREEHQKLSSTWFHRFLPRSNGHNLDAPVRHERLRPSGCDAHNERRRSERTTDFVYQRMISPAEGAGFGLRTVGTQVDHEVRGRPS